MNSEINKFENLIKSLSEDLPKILTEEDKSNSKEKIKIVFDQIINQFRRDLESNPKAKKDFIDMPPEDWDVKVLNPLIELAQKHFTKIFGLEESAKKITEYTEKRNKLLHYIDEHKTCDHMIDELYLDEHE